MVLWNIWWDLLSLGRHCITQKRFQEVSVLGSCPFRMYMKFLILFPQHFHFYGTAYYTAIQSALHRLCNQILIITLTTEWKLQCSVITFIFIKGTYISEYLAEAFLSGKFINRLFTINLGNLLIVLHLFSRYSAYSRESSSPVCCQSIKAFPPAGWCTLLKRKATWFANHLWMSQEVIGPSETEHDNMILLQIIIATWGLFGAIIIVLNLKISIKMWVLVYKSVRRLNHVQL